MKEKIKKQKNKKLETDISKKQFAMDSSLKFLGAKSPFLEGTVISDWQNLMETKLKTVSELSKSLSLAMPNQELLKDYNNVLNLQKSTFEQIQDLSGRFKGEIAPHFNTIVSDMVAPVSSAIAGIGLATANANQLFNLGKIDGPAFTSVQKLSDLCLDTIQWQQMDTLSSLKMIQDAGSIMNRLVGDSTASLKMITNGLDGAIRSTPAFPSVLDLPDLEVVRGKAVITKEELAEHQRKLDNLLQKIDPELVEFRLGCWSIFHTKSYDYIGQASSSMRRLVDNLLWFIAPNEEVTNTKYFKTSPETKNGKITRRARIYCATDYDRKKAKHLKRLATGLLSEYSNLSAWDHKPEKLHDFIYGSFIAIEGYLLSLLSELRK